MNSRTGKRRPRQNRPARTPAEPVPHWVGSIAALSLAASFLLVVRLGLVHAMPALHPHAEAATPAREPSLQRFTPPPPHDPPPPRDPPAPASAAAVRAFVEGWRIARQTRDLDGYLSHYSDGFSATGQQRDAWVEETRASFADQATPSPRLVELESSVTANDATLVSLIEERQVGRRRRRHHRNLTLVDEAGRLKIAKDETRAVSP